MKVEAMIQINSCGQTRDSAEPGRVGESRKKLCVGGQEGSKILMVVRAVSELKGPLGATDLFHQSVKSL